MPLRFPCLPVQRFPGSILFPYWGALGFHRPMLELYLLGPRGLVDSEPAQIDTGADFNVWSAALAFGIGLIPPFPRQAAVSGAAGMQAGTFTAPPDGLVSLFVTDYREYAFLPAPLVCFHSPGVG